MFTVLQKPCENHVTVVGVAAGVVAVAVVPFIPVK